MSKLETERATACSEKFGFKSATDARKALKNKPKAVISQLAVYRCSFCPCWHIGHKPKSGTRKDHWRKYVNNLKKEKRNEHRKSDQNNQRGWIQD